MNSKKYARTGGVAPVAAGEDVEPNRLAHWHDADEYWAWKEWRDVPPSVREIIASELLRDAEDREARANRSTRPNQAIFERMWAHVARLAAAELAR